MSTQVTAKPVTIQDFAAGLRILPESAFDRTDQVTDFLRSAPVVPDTLAPYLERVTKLPKPDPLRRAHADGRQTKVDLEGDFPAFPRMPEAEELKMIDGFFTAVFAEDTVTLRNWPEVHA